MRRGPGGCYAAARRHHPIIMAWLPLTVDELLQEFTPLEKSTLDHLQSPQGGPSSLAPILARSVAKFRGAIRAGGQAPANGDTIPDDVRDEVIAHARWRFLIAFPSLKALQTQERKEAYEAAEKLIDKLRNGLAVENAEDESKTGGVRPCFGVRTRDFTRAKMDG